MKNKIQLNLQYDEISQERYYYYLLSTENEKPKFFDLKVPKIPVCHVKKNEKKYKEIIENQNIHKLVFEIQNNSVENQIGDYSINFKILETKTSIIITLAFKLNKKDIGDFFTILEKEKGKEEKAIEEDEKEKEKKERENNNDKKNDKNYDKNKEKDEDNNSSISDDKNNEIKDESSKCNMLIDNNSNLNKDKLLKSKIGLINPAATCYMASMLQALIHSEIFLNYFIKNKKENNYLSNILTQLFNQIESTTEKCIPLKDFAFNYNKIDNRYHPLQGNTPSCFLNHILYNLNKEIKGISDLFHGKIKISFKKNKKFNVEQGFIVYLKNFNNDLKSELFCSELQEIDGSNDEVLEELIIYPSIFIINGYPQNNFKVSKELNLKKANYILYAINEYNDYHSTM